MTRLSYRDTLDSLLEGFQIIGRDWTYLYVNPAAARHGQRTPEELIGRRMGEMYPGIESTPVFAALERCMIGREPDALEVQFTFPDGTKRWFDLRVQPVLEGICVHSIDIQSRKAAEAALREQESAAALGHMAAMVAHEVKNPLAGLSGALQVLQRRRAPGDPEIQVFDEMLRSIRSLERLIRDLLDFAKPIQIDPVPLSVPDLVRETVRLLSNDDQVGAHAVAVTAEEPAPAVRADPELLTHVLRNLILNAAQAMTTPGAIGVRVEHDLNACRVTVSDTGPGVAPSQHARMFEPFVTGRKGGTGLGLAISRRIARLHGGDLALLSGSSAGAVFQLTVPLQPSSSPAARAPRPASGSSVV